MLYQSFQLEKFKANIILNKSHKIIDIFNVEFISKIDFTEQFFIINLKIVFK